MKSYAVFVWCASCGMQLWTGLTNKEKAEKVAEGLADNLRCCDCIITQVNRKEPR